MTSITAAAPDPPRPRRRDAPRASRADQAESSEQEMSDLHSTDRARLPLGKRGAFEGVARRHGRRRNPARRTPRSSLRTPTNQPRHRPQRWVEKCGRSIKGSETPQLMLPPRANVAQFLLAAIADRPPRSNLPPDARPAPAVAKSLKPGNKRRPAPFAGPLPGGADPRGELGGATGMPNLASVFERCAWTVYALMSSPRGEPGQTGRRPSVRGALLAG